MKNCRFLLFRSLSVCFLLWVFCGGVVGLFAQSAKIDWSTNEGFAQALNNVSNEYDQRITNLNTIAANAKFDIYQAEQKLVFWNFLKDLFDRRSNHYYKAGAFKNPSPLQSLIYNVDRNHYIIESANVPTLQNMYLIIQQEVAIFNLGDRSFDDSLLDDLWLITGKLGTGILSDTLNLFRDVLLKIVDDRAGTDKKSLVNFVLIAEGTVTNWGLVNLLETIVETNLFSSSDNAKFGTLIKHIQLEVDLTNVQQKTVLSEQLSALKPLLENNKTGTFGEITQNIAEVTLTGVSGKKNQVTDVEQLKSPIIPGLKACCAAASGSTLFAKHTLAITSLSSIIDFEQTIVDAFAKTTFADLSAAVGGIVNNSTGKTIEKSANLLFDALLEALYALRPSDDASKLGELKTLLNNAKASTVPSQVMRGTTIPVWIAEINTQMSQAEIFKKLQDIIALTNNNDRVSQLSSFLTTYASQTFSDALKNLLFTALEKSFNSRDALGNSLTLTQKQAIIVRHNALKTMLKKATLSSHVADKKTTIQEWIKVVADEIVLLSIDISVPFPGPVPPQPPVVYPEPTQSYLFQELKKQYDARQQIITVLESLKTYLNSWLAYLNNGNKNTVTTIWIPTIDAEIQALKNKEEGEKEPDKRDPDKIKEPVGDGDRDNYFAGLQELYTNRVKTLDRLTWLKNYILSWIPPIKSFLMFTENQHATITKVWIPNIDLEIALLRFTVPTPTQPYIVYPGDLPTPLEEPYVSQLFEYLKKVYQARDTSLKSSLESTKAYLTPWSTDNGRLQGKQVTIATIWIPQIDWEIAALGGKIPPTPPPGPVGPDDIARIFKQLEDEYKARNTKSVMVLTALKVKLNNYTTLDKPFNAAQIQTITGIWIPQIERELAYLDWKLPGGGEGGVAVPTWPLPGWPDVIWPPEPITQEDLDLLFNVLKKRYDERDRTSKSALTTLKEDLQKYVGADTKFSGQQVQTISGVWIPQIDKELAYLDWRSNPTPTWPPSYWPSLWPPEPITQEDLDVLFNALKKRYDERDTKSKSALTTLKEDLQKYVATGTKFSSQQVQTISGVWIPQIDKELAYLDWKSNPTPTWPPSYWPSLWPPEPITQEDLDVLFNALKKRYDERDTKSKSALTTLKEDLQKYVATGTKFNSQQVQTISGVWIPQIDKELAYFDWKSNPTPTWPPPYWPSLWPSEPIGPDDLTLLFNVLKKRYDERDKTSKSALTTLKSDLQKYIAPDTKFSGQQVQTISGVWIPQIDLDILALDFKDKSSTPPFGEYPDGWPTPLAEPYVSELFAYLQRVYQARNPESLQNLQDVKTYLTPWSNDHGRLQGKEVTIATVWIPQIDKEIRILTFTSDPFAGPDGGPGPDLGPLTPKQQDDIFAQLQKAYNERKKTLVELQKLSGTLQKWLDSNLLSTQQNTTIRDTWLPTIAGEIREIVFTNAINNAIRLTNYAQLLTALNTIMTDGASFTFTSNVQILFFNALVGAFNQRTGKGDELVAQLKELLSRATTSPLLSSAQQTQVAQWITVLQGEVGASEILLLIEQALALTDYQAKLNATLPILQKGANLTVEINVSNKFFTLLQQEYQGRTGKDRTLLVLLVTIFRQAVTSPLLTQAQKDIVAKALETLELDLAMRDAEQLTTYVDLLNALYDIMFQYDRVQNVASATQKSFYTSLQKVFSLRGQEYDLTKIRLETINITKLALLLNKAADSILITNTNRPTVQLYSDIVTLEQMLIDIPKKADYTTQLADMLKVVRVAQGRTYDQVTYYVYFAILSSLYEKRNPQNSVEIQTLIAVLQGSLVAPLLDAAGQQTVRSWLASLGMTTAEPTPAQKEVWKVIEKDTVQEKVAQFVLLIDYIKGSSLDAATKNQIAALIQQLYELVAKSGDQAAKASVAQVLQTVASSNVLAPAQQEYVTATLVPSLTGTAVSAPETYVETVDWDIKPEDDKVVGVDPVTGKSTLILQPKKVTRVTASTKNITTAMQSKSTSAKVEGMIRVAAGINKKKPSAAVITSFVKNVAELGQTVGSMSSSELALYAQLLGTASGLTALTSAQKKQVNEVLIPSLLQTLMQKPSSGEIISVLSMVAQTIKTASSATKNACAAAFVELEKRYKAGTLTPEEQIAFMQLAELLGASAVLTSAQKTYVKNIQKTVEQAAIKPQEVIQAALQDVAKTTDSKKQQTTLSTLINQLAGKTLTSDEKNALAAVVSQVYAHAIDDEDAATLTSLQKTLEGVAAANVLAPEQTSYITSTLVPQVQAYAQVAPNLVTEQSPELVEDKATKVIAKPVQVSNVTPTSKNIKAVLNKKTMNTQVTGLLQIAQGAVAKKPSATVTKALASAVSTLSKKVSTMNKGEEERYAQLLGTALGIKSLSAAQKKEIQEKLIPGFVSSVIKKQKPAELVSVTSVLIASLGNNVTAKTQDALADSVDALVTLYREGKMSDAEKQAFMQLLDELSQSPALTTEQRSYTAQLSTQLKTTGTLDAAAPSPAPTTPTTPVTSTAPTPEAPATPTTPAQPEAEVFVDDPSLIASSPATLVRPVSVQALAATSKNIKAALAKPTITSKIAGLLQITQGAITQKSSNTVIIALTNAVSSINKQASAMDKTASDRYAQLLGSMGWVTGVPAKQQKQIQEKEVPSFVKKMVKKQAPMQLMSATSILAATLGKKSKVATQDAIADAIDSLEKLHRNRKLNDVEKAAFTQLLNELSQSEALTAAQKTYAAQLGAFVQGVGKDPLVIAQEEASQKQQETQDKKVEKDKKTSRSSSKKSARVGTKKITTSKTATQVTETKAASVKGKMPSALKMPSAIKMPAARKSLTEKSSKSSVADSVSSTVSGRTRDTGVRGSLVTPTGTVLSNMNNLLSGLKSSGVFSTKLAMLGNLLSITRGVNIPSAQQKTFENLLSQLAKEIPAGDVTMINTFITHLRSAAESSLISESKRSWISDTLIAQVQKKIRK